MAIRTAIVIAFTEESRPRSGAIPKKNPLAKHRSIAFFIRLSLFLFGFEMCCFSGLLDERPVRFAEEENGEGRKQRG